MSDQPLRTSPSFAEMSQIKTVRIKGGQRGDLTHALPVERLPVRLSHVSTTSHSDLGGENMYDAAQQVPGAQGTMEAPTLRWGRPGPLTAELEVCASDPICPGPALSPGATPREQPFQVPHVSTELVRCLSFWAWLASRRVFTADSDPGGRCG